jgi:hypothetical protein
MDHGIGYDQIITKMLLGILFPVLCFLFRVSRVGHPMTAAGEPPKVVGPAALLRMAIYEYSKKLERMQRSGMNEEEESK